jgi:rod shape-determining protein MreC
MNKRGRARRLTIAALIVLAAVFLQLSGWLKPLYDPFSRLVLMVAAPIHAAGSSAGAFFDRLTGGGTDDPAALRRTIDDLKTENAKLLALSTENEQLKAALDFTERDKDRSVTARVVYESDENDTRLLILDRGSDDGVAVGQPVTAGSGIIIGKIMAVRSRSSTVMPLMDSRSRLAVTVLNAQETLGVLEGDRDLSMSISLIPQTENLSPGDTVISSGLEPGIRRGLVVGVIEKVNRSTQDPFQAANVTPFASARHPLFVQVIRAGQDE